MEGIAINTKPPRQAPKAPGPLAKYRNLIIIGAALVVIAGGAYLFWAQERAKKYDEAFRKGMAAWNQRDGEKGAADFRKAAKIDDRDPELWVLIGRCEFAAGHPERAGEAWEEALKHEPKYKPALFERGKEALGRNITHRIPPPTDGPNGWLPLRLLPPDGADEVARIQADLREAAPHSPAFTDFARGAIYLLDGKYPAALPGFDKYTELNAWDTTAIAMAGVAAQYAAQPLRAERSLTEALKRRSEKPWLKVRADARYLQGNTNGAREDYKEAGLEKEAEPLFARRIPAQGLILWLRSDAGVDLDGTTVTRWQDQSGSKNDAAPKEPALGPKVSASAVRGLPAIQFGGKEDDLHLPDGFEDFSAGMSMFVVGEPMTEPAEEWSFLLLATPARGAARVEALIGRRRESDQVVYSAEDLTKQHKPFIGGVPLAKGFDAYGALHEPNGDVKLTRRGEPVANGNLLVPRKILRTRNRVGAGLKGRVAEIVLYRRTLSEMERLGVDVYLKDRYFPDAPSGKP